MLPLGICNGKIVTNNLNGSSCGQGCPRIPIILIDFFVFQNIWCKTTLVTDCRGIKTELLLDTCFQMMVDFTAHFHRFCEIRRATCFQGFMNASRGTRWYCSTEESQLGNKIDLKEQIILVKEYLIRYYTLKNDRIHALFTIVSRRNRDDKFPSNGNER
ncbi:hypothetical protein ALC62_04945 [Cyphomyrmex costatus]|uniref:Uncharacterized protein n=1 Tax=Cyphomyrmex costatus TaxID=456900 RepID=A0A195CU54_9HYME|nr:hypothetical protein ALC62_04945 [Cyphomyrmex costatus]